jgi:hypothetical protein
LAIVTNAGWDAVDAAASARQVVAGRFSVSDARRTDERRCCVRQNRVVPASVADAKLSVAETDPTGSFRPQAGSDGDKNEFVAEEITP